MTIKTLTASVLGLSLLAQPALATCTDHGDGDAALAAQTRLAVLWGNYPAMAKFLDPQESKWTEQIEILTESLQTEFEDGFDSCEVLVRRQISPVLYQEISVFSKTDKELLFFYFLVATIDDKERVLNFRVAPDPTEMLRELK